MAYEPTKRVSFQVTDNEGTIHQVNMVNGTSVKESMDTNTSSVATFDGVVTQGTNLTPYSLDMSRINYEGAATYKEIRDILNLLVDIPGEVSVSWDVYPLGETPFTITKFYSGCILDGKDYEVKPEEHTVENIKFKCAELYEPDPELLG